MPTASASERSIRAWTVVDSLQQQPAHHVELDLGCVDHLGDRHALVRRMPLRARPGAEVDDLDAVIGVVAAVAHAGGVEEPGLAAGPGLHRRLEGRDRLAVRGRGEAVGAGQELYRVL